MTPVLNQAPVDAPYRPTRRWLLALAVGAVALLVLPPFRPVRAAGGPSDVAVEVDGAARRLVARRFAKSGFAGCFLLADVERGVLVRVGGERCARRLPPCSTFKLPHAMIALDANVLQGASDAKRWDGRPQPFRAWERDHTLQSAFASSVLWYFQRVAAEVGRVRMQGYLDQLSYGNRRISGALTRFWIDGSLRISAEEQLRLLRQLYRDRLPLSAGARRVARELMGGDAFGGKTGTCKIGGKLTTGWYVGHLRRGKRDYVFVTLIQADDNAWGHRARALSRDLLASLKLL
jgi:beta-lactamase class D